VHGGCTYFCTKVCQYHIKINELKEGLNVFFTPSSHEHVLMGFFLTVDAWWAPFSGFEFFLLGFLVSFALSSNSSAFEVFCHLKTTKKYLASP
jgi:hypothetical protein